MNNEDYTDEEITSLATKLETEPSDIREALSPDLSWITELEKASTFEEAESIWDEASEDSDAKFAALRKMIEYASTYAQAESAWRKTPNGSETEHAALMKMLECASDFTEVHTVYSNACCRSSAERAALVRMLEMRRAKKAAKTKTT